VSYFWTSPRLGLAIGRVLSWLVLFDTSHLADEWGIGVLLVEHDMNFVVSVCDDIVVLDFGRKISIGLPDEVRRDPVVVAAYLGEDDTGDVRGGVRSQGHDDACRFA